jgi:aspartyl-tRNA synthetase
MKQWYEEDASVVNGSTYNIERENDNFKFVYNKKTHETIRARDFLFRGIREYLQDNDFVELQMPSIVKCSTDPVQEPGRELFPIDWYGKQMYLAQSAQIHKQMAIGAGFNKVFSIAPFFRKESRNSKRHLGEAWSLDVELSGVKDHNDIINVLINTIDYGVNYLKNKMPSLTSVIEDTELTRKPVFKITYDEAIKKLNQIGLKIRRGEDIGPEREHILGKYLKFNKDVDTFIIEKYPDSVKKFYVAHESSDLTQTFDLIYKGWEIVSGAKRETDYDKVYKCLKNEGMDLKQYKAYLEVFCRGLPKHGGFGLGLDRLLARLLNIDDIRKTLLFPRAKNITAP